MVSCLCCGFEAQDDVRKKPCEVCAWTAKSKITLETARKNFLLLGVSNPHAKNPKIVSTLPYKRKKYFELNPDSEVVERSLKEIQNPLLRFKTWYEEAWKSLGENADAIALSTLNTKKNPQLRILYFRGLWSNNFCFFTNYSSDKAIGLKEGSSVAIVFLWHTLDRQLRVEGTVKKADKKISDDYFSKRPLESQLSAITSQQSQKLGCYNDFLLEIEAKRKKTKLPIERPENWGGYALEAERMEFWHGRKYRRHLRELYTKEKTSKDWKQELLYP